MRWTRYRSGRMTMSRTAKSCGPGAPTLALSPQRCFGILRVTVANKPGSPGRARISRKTIAQGRPDCPARTCGSCPVHFLRTGAMGAIGTRPSLRPLHAMRVVRLENSDATRRENADVRLPPLSCPASSGAPSIPETYRLCTNVSGILDRLIAPD